MADFSRKLEKIFFFFFFIENKINTLANISPNFVFDAQCRMLTKACSPACKIVRIFPIHIIYMVENIENMYGKSCKCYASKTAFVNSLN